MRRHQLEGVGFELGAMGAVVEREVRGQVGGGLMVVHGTWPRPTAERHSLLAHAGVIADAGRRCHQGRASRVAVVWVLAPRIIALLNWSTGNRRKRRTDGRR
ncbi:MAG: hypothetical protein JWQ95_6375 [Sphaerisporangium sp.]|nr:hypothetical protein [Sphaerisporangium sp.]